jgi:hypothetical protein
MNFWREPFHCGARVGSGAHLLDYQDSWAHNGSVHPGGSNVLKKEEDVKRICDCLQKSRTFWRGRFNRAKMVECLAPQFKLEHFDDDSPYGSYLNWSDIKHNEA